MSIDPEFIKKLNKYPLDEQKEYLKTYCKADERQIQDKISEDFMQFIHYIWPEFIGG